MDIVSILIMVLAISVAWFMPAKNRVLGWVTVAYALAWAIVANKAPDLWTIALLGFIQNVAFTFVSRGRNSGSLGYHLVASIFSNGIYAALLFVSIDQVTQAKQNPGMFLAVYTLATMSGSIFAHWLALRMEKGKQKTMTEDKFETLRRRVTELESRLGVGPVCERLIEKFLPDGRTVRVWAPLEDSQNLVFRLEGLMKGDGLSEVESYELARQFGEALNANAVQIGSGKQGGYVYYRNWP